MKKLILFLLIIAASISGFKVFSTYNNYRQASMYYKTTQTAYVHTVAPTATPKPTVTPASTKAATLTPSPTLVPYHTTTIQPPIEIDFAALTKSNPDVIGWIYCEDTVINYPIMHTNNNVYYLKRLMDKSYSANGSIFLDAANNPDFSDDNSILYGHHMRDGSMFAAIEKYKDQKFYEEHPHLWLLTPQQNYMLIPFAGGVVKPTRNYFVTTFASATSRADYIAQAITTSEFTGTIAPYTDDRLMSLATCDYTFDNARFMLLCILVPCEK